jgi:hypothetical protein
MLQNVLSKVLSSITPDCLTKIMERMEQCVEKAESMTEEERKELVEKISKKYSTFQ